jgi:hypothetical protein
MFSVGNPGETALSFSPPTNIMAILEGIPDSSTERSQPPGVPSTMTILEGSSNFTIQRSHFNNVVGPQYNNIYHGNVTMQQVNQERQLTIWDEVCRHSSMALCKYSTNICFQFTRVPTGQVYITKTWGTSDIEQGLDRNRRNKRGRRGIDAKCTINTARIGNSEYLHIGYSGADASEAGISRVQYSVQ